MSNLKQQGIKAFIWDFSGKLASQGVSFVISIFLARLLEPAEFGLIAMIMVVIGMASVFTDVGLGSALIQRKRVLPVHYASVFYFNVFVGLLLTLITYCSAGWIAQLYQNDALLPLAQVMSLSFVINGFGSVQSTKLRKELNYAVLTKAGFIAGLIGGMVGVTLAFQDFGVWSLVAQTLISGVAYNILLWSWSQWKPSWLFSVKALKQLWGFGFRMFLAELLNAIFTRLDYLIIGKLFLPVTLGFFQRAKSLNILVIQYSSGSLMSILFPLFSQVKNDLPRFQRIVIKALGIICFIVFLLLGELYLLSEELIVFIYSEKWLPSVNYFQLLLLSGFGYPISSLLINVLTSRGNSKIILRIQIYKNIINSVNLSFVFLWGIEGYLYGLIITTIVGVSLNVFAVSHEIKIPVYDFFRIILMQCIVVISSVLITVNAVNYFYVMPIYLFFVKGVLFIIFYLTLSRIFKTSSYQSTLEQFFCFFRKTNTI